MTFTIAVRPASNVASCCGVLGAIVEAGQQHVFEREPPAAALEIMVGLGQDIGQRNLLADRHDLAAQLVVRRVERHGQTVARRRYRQAGAWPSAGRPWRS